MSEKEKKLKDDKKLWDALPKKDKKVLERIEKALAHEQKHLQRIEDDHTEALLQDARREAKSKKAKLQKKQDNRLALVEKRLANKSQLERRKHILERVNAHLRLSLESKRSGK